jgi:hypothetical protein
MAALVAAIVDFVRPVGQAQRALARVGARKARIGGHACTAPSLDRIVDDLQRHAGRRHLDLRDFLTGHLVADLVHHVGRL